LTTQITAAADSAVAYRLSEGGFSPVADEAMVRARLRASAPDVDPVRFDAMAEAVLGRARDLSVMEAALEDPWDTKAWEAQADEVRMEAIDYPGDTQDWSTGDSTTDWQGYCEAVHDEVSLRLYLACAELGRAQQEASATAQASRWDTSIALD
jgi:hypothetical protein